MNLLWRTLILAGCAAAAGMGTSAVKAQTPQRTVLTGHLQDVVPSLQPLGRLDGSTRLRLSINLPLRNRAALADFIEALYDPESRLYHHYLAPEEFTARFGPTAEDYQAVIAWAEGSGFTVTARHPGRTLLEVSAAVADIERALQVAMRTYAHPTEARAFYSPDIEPSVETGVPILWIGGLDDFNRPHPKNLRRTFLKAVTNATAENAGVIPSSRRLDATTISSRGLDAAQKVEGNATPQTVGSGPNGNLAGYDYRAAYAPGVTLTGTGQMVGLLEFDGYYQTDIASYESLTGVPNVPLQNILLDEFSGYPGEYDSEVALDIEMAISMAPGLSKVVVFEAGANGQPNDVLEAMSTNTLIKQFSCSWSFGTPIPSSQRTSMDDYFQQFETQGQSFFCASGDSGAATNGVAIAAPDDDPYITLAGGTTLGTAGAGAPWLSETVWNAGMGPGADNSGGGISTVYAIPTWQKGVNMSTNSGSTSYRNCPDVAMVADNIFIVADDGYEETTGGTSCAAPLWAGFAALANQQAVAAGSTNIGFVNPAIYRIGTNSGFTACFDDISVGNNTNNSATHFLAMPGYDLCTGWGSPAGGSLIIALTQPDGFQITPGRGAVANGPAGGPFTVTTQTFLLTNTGKTSFKWALGATPAWQNVSSSGGTLAAGGAASVTVTLNSAAGLLPAGLYTNQLWFTNLSSGLAQMRQFTLQAGQELAQDGGFEAGDFCYWTLSGDANIYAYNFVDYAYDTEGADYSPYDGNYFAAFSQYSDLAYLSQTLPTLSNQLYLVSIWLENPEGATPNQFLIRWNTNSTTTNVIFNQTNMGAFGWSNLVFTVKATTNTAALQFGFRNDNDYFCLDDVSVKPLPAPSIQALAPGNGTFQLSWTALAGAAYQVQYLTNVLQTNWLNLGGVITATNNPMTFSASVTARSQRFYRVMLLP
jgi:hypothetical protein